MTGIPECVIAALAFGGPPAALPLPTACPPALAPWARPAVTPNYQPRLVGGGVGPKHGRAPTAEEGVWGLDFLGRWRLRRVKLWWPREAAEREPKPGKDPTHYENKLPETPAPPLLRKL